VKKLIAATLFWIALAIPACSIPNLPTSTVTPTQTFTAIPVLTTTLPPTSAPLPPTATPDVVSGLIPEGQPDSEWKGIPIMPGAIAGDGDEEGYVFTIKSTPQQVQEYYQLELGKLGWQLFATGDGDPSRMLMFMDVASTTLTVSIIARGDEVLVLLVK